VGKNTNRLEAFSDGVFAVAITLLVLNVQVPHIKDGSLLDALIKQWPVYLSYFISFATIGIVWANHHRTYEYIQRADHNLLILNLLLLMTVTLNPFTSALLAEYIQVPGEQQTAAFIYAAGWTGLAIAYNLMWRYAVRQNLVNPELTPEALKRITGRNNTGVIFYAVATVAALVSAAISVFTCFALALFFLIPSSAE